MAERQQKPDPASRGGFKPAIQNFSEFVAAKVEPGKQAKGLNLGPGYYTLSVRGNVPFVKLVGADRSQKTFSWGETIAIQEQKNVTVFNASYHTGDIIINGGQDWATVPGRVTVPVTPTFIDAGSNWNFAVPRVDTRRARTVWLMMGPGIVSPTTVNRKGVRIIGSHDTGNQAVGAQWTDSFSANGSYIPMGFLADNTVRPMSNLDTVEVTSMLVLKSEVPDPTKLLAYYTLEYL